MHNIGTFPFLSLLSPFFSSLFFAFLCSCLFCWDEILLFDFPCLCAWTIGVCWGGLVGFEVNELSLVAEIVFFRVIDCKLVFTDNVNAHRKGRGNKKKALLYCKMKEKNQR